MRQTKIPCVLMRGGTSKGPFFRLADLPDPVTDRAAFEAVLLAAMGSPDVRQIDGIGGADPLTSKVAILSPSTRPGIDVDYLFAQVSVEKALVDTNPNCGNMITGVGPFAIEEGWVQAAEGETTVRIFNVNTSVQTNAIVSTPDGFVNYDEGDCAIDGVPGTAAPVKLDFVGGAGSKTAGLLPTGRPTDMIDGVPVSLVDFGMPIMFLAAPSLGKTGYESAADLDADRDFFARSEALRLKAGAMMGLGDVAEKVIPKVVLVAPPRQGGNITGRYLMPHKAHKAYAVTGSLNTAITCLLPGTVAAPLAVVPNGRFKPMQIEHPSGRMGVEVGVELPADGNPANARITRAAVLRTTRRLFEGSVLVPHRVWAGRSAAPMAKAAE